MNRPFVGPGRLGLGIAAAAGVLLAAEGVLRLAPDPDPTLLARPEQTLEGFQPIQMHGNPYLLWELVPGARQESGHTVTVNSLGLRGGEPGKQGLPRAVALGDSSVHGAGVGDESLFTARLARSLPAEFLNAAVPGYSTEQALNALNQKVLPLHPDLLLVMTLWSDNNFDHFVDREVLRRYTDYEGTRAGRVRSLLNHSRLFRWLDLGVVAARGELHIGRVGWMTEEISAESTGRRRVPIADYADNLATFCSIMEDQGGGVLFAVLPNREDLRSPGSPHPWDPYREVMRRTATACGAPLVDLARAFQEAGERDGNLFIDEMHPTDRGHAVLALTLGSALHGLGWPATPIRVHAPGPVEVPDDPYEGHGVEMGLIGNKVQPGGAGAAPPEKPGPRSW